MALSGTELAKLKKATYASMCQDRQKLLVRFPFTGGILMRMEFVPVRDRRLRTAATDGDRVFMDIAFCAGLSASSCTCSAVRRASVSCSTSRRTWR